MRNVSWSPARLRGRFGSVSRSSALVAVLAMTPPVSPFRAVLHLSLAYSVPAEDSHQTTAPAEIRLAFTGPVDVSRVEIELLGPDKRPVALKPPRAVDRYPHLAVAAIPVKLMPGGNYTVRWRAVAADGDPASGYFRFMYMPPAAEPPPDQ